MNYKTANRSILLERYDAFIFDLDGVIWKGPEIIPGALEAVNILRNARKKILFVTNNASESRAYQHKKLLNMGIPCELNEFLSAGFGTASYLGKNFPGASAYVMGTDHLTQEIEEAGLRISNTDADLVVVGFDRDFSYKKLDIAFNNLYRKKCLFVACNQNPIYPAPDGFHPGVGPSVAALSYAIGREPDLVIGKPNLPLLEMSLSLLNTTSEKTAIFGDILDMDILWGKQKNLGTIYVLSGVGVIEDIEKLNIEPDFIANSVIDALN
ncbi:MAG TPA: HAD-IIA family hydrolase [Oligoflexia bacterium]|nr:HAD-IIA family hydrolase [Oligoflexia bacterium]HMP47299.1 HAD-IIA family hydrolase [Oligoflexia bacterium]